MKRNFKAVRMAFVISVMAIAGAIGGALSRAVISNNPVESGESEASVDLSSDVASTDNGDSRSEEGSEFDGDVDVPELEFINQSVGMILNTGTQAAANAVMHGDLLLEEGRVSEAVRYFRHLLANAAPETALMDVRYRLGLCAEALCNYEEALANYQQVVHAADTEVVGELAWLGQARVYLKRKEPIAAQQMLRLWVLQSNETALRSVPVAHHALYLLATLSTETALKDSEAPLWDEQGIARPGSSFEPSDFLPREFEALTREPANVDVGIRLLHKLRIAEPGSSYFEAKLARTSVYRVLQQICEEPGWELQMTPVAEKMVRAQSIQLNFTEKSADLLFDVLLSPLSLAWSFQNGVLQVVGESEFSAEELDQFRRSLAERSLYFALLSAPNHERSPVAYLLLGALSFQAQDYPAARRHFESILQTSPRSSVAPEAWFNAAKVAIAEGNMDRAQQALLGAMDVSRGHPLEPVTLLLSARNSLQFDDPNTAVRPLVRAVTLATNEDVRAIALLTLASAHLIADRPESANVSLMEDRQLLQHGPFRDRAALLAALARFRSASTPWRIDRDGRALISALSHIQHEDWTSLHDDLLTAEAYEALGLADRAISILEMATQRFAASPLRTRMQFRLAELYQRRGTSDQAKVVLTSLSENTSTEIASESLIKLANLHVRQHEADRAEQICRDLLLLELNQERRIDVLRLLGGIYARRGDRERAVLCFSGVAPQLSEATLRSSSTNSSAPSRIEGESPVSIEGEAGP